ncbi:MAG TPA: 3D domain-containing protein [Phycisphaeraceae bacterium]
MGRINRAWAWGLSSSAWGAAPLVLLAVVAGVGALGLLIMLPGVDSAEGVSLMAIDRLPADLPEWAPSSDPSASIASSESVDQPQASPADLAEPVAVQVVQAAQEAAPEPSAAQQIQPAPHVPHDPQVPTFDGRPLRKVGEISMLVTAYSPDERSCGDSADGITASGYSVWTNGMKLAAADTRLLPFGTIISVPGYNSGRPIQVLDRGGKIKGHRLDVLYPTHEAALQWGVQRLTVTIWEYAD